RAPKTAYLFPLHRRRPAAYSLTLPAALPISRGAAPLRDRKRTCLFAFHRRRRVALCLRAAPAAPPEPEPRPPASKPFYSSLADKIGRAHLWTPVTWSSRMPSSAG